MPCEHVSALLSSAHPDTSNFLVVAGETALTLAAGAGEQLTVQLLLEHGADISRCRTAGAQAIHTAAASGAHHACMVRCCAVLCCAVLCCAVLCCAVLCCAVLCCAVPKRAVLCRTVLCCAEPCCAVLCRAVPCRAVLCCAVLYGASTKHGLAWHSHDHPLARGPNKQNALSMLTVAMLCTALVTLMCT